MRFNQGWPLLMGVLLLVFALSSFSTPIVAADREQVIQIKAKKFEYLPNEITLKKGIPVVLELSSLDRLHGFNCPAFGVHADIQPQKVTKVRFVPDKVGTFEFHCDIFCGDGHEHMEGKFMVTE